MYDAAGAATAATVADTAQSTQPDHADTSAEAKATEQTGDPRISPDAVALPGDRESAGVAQPPPVADMAPPPVEIVFVDADLPDIGQLTSGSGVEIVLLDPSRDGIAQVSEALAGRQGVTALHFVGHGDAGSFTLGGTRIDSASLSQAASEVAGWSAALSPDADIMIWGCDVASLPSGEALLSSLALLTGADVAASNDATGIGSRGGDWTLEVTQGLVTSGTPFEADALAAWDHLLAPPAVTGAAKLTVTEPSSLNLPGADRSSFSAWQFTSTAAGNVTVTATLSDAAIGSLLDGSGLGSAITGGWSFTGTLAQANAWLDSVSFVAADAERGNGAAQAMITLGITDADGGSASQAVAVEVTPSNDPTILDDPSTAVVEGGSRTLDQSVLAPLDPELGIGAQIPSQIVYRVTADPVHGYLVLNGQRIGVGSVFTQQDVIDGRLSYVHTAAGADQNTNDSFSVSINDGATPQASSDTAIVTLAITPVNQAPTVSGSGAVYEGQPANAVDGGGVPQSAVGNFITATGGGDPGDAVLTVELTDLPDHGTLYFTGTAVVGGVTQSLSNHAITAGDISAGFAFAYADRAGLTYANDGIDVAGRPPNDSFGVRVTDGGGGSGTPLSTTATIGINVRPVNDDPTLVPGSTLNATVPAPTGAPATDYKVTLTPAMLDAADVDSAPENITFVVTSQAGLDQGRLVYDSGSGPTLLPDGGSFTLADVLAGRIQYWQMAGASAGQTDTFTFQVVDNAVAPHWNPDGTSFERIGGIYTGPASTDALQPFIFTINLAATPTGADGSGLPNRDVATTGTTSNHAGTQPGGATYGTLVEGGSVVLTNGTGGEPGLNYGATGVDPAQVVYTILGLDGAGPAWNGELQKFNGSSWVRLDVFDTFTQADLDAGLVRFQHDGGEDFESSVKLQATAGVLVSDGSGGFTTDQWNTDFFFYVTPVNDAPTATGSSDNVLDEGAATAITRDMLDFGDADDAASESYLEGTATLPGGGNNYAVNHDGAEPLTFTVTADPQHGRLEYKDGAGNWQLVPAGMEIDAAWITDDPATTRLRYVHDGSEARTDGFSAVATDRWGATSNVAAVGFVITNINDAPQIAPNPTAADPTGNLPGTTTPGTGANQPLNIIYEGSYSQITSAMLQAIDPDSTAEQVQYRITSAPAHGRIAYSTDGISFVTIGVGSSFSQADVAAGRIYYLSDGTDPVSDGYPNTPDDKFVFTLADGAAEQTGREFWVYLEPTNDAPVVTAPSGPIPVTDTLTSVPGFSVADPDLTDLNSAQEVNFLEVVVRLLKQNGDPLTAGDYADVDISVTAGAGLTIDADHDGNGDYLVLRGTREAINNALSTLQVSFGTDRDAIYQVEVIADDRVRDANGNLVDRDPDTAGSQPGGNGGGTLNQPQTTLTGDATAVLDTAFDWYVDRAPTTGLIMGNISAARVSIWASSQNDPAALGSTNDAATVYEDQATPIGAAIDFQIADSESAAFGSPVTVTLQVPTGMLNVGSDPDVTVSGRGTGTLVLTGTAAEIQALLNASLTYRSALNDNADSNDAAPGDVTLTVSFSDTGSNLGDGQTANNPADLSIGLTIVPVNDAPTVSAGTGTVVVAGPTAVPGFAVGDVDLADGTAAGENDFVAVTVRLTDAAGNPLSSVQHGEVLFSSTSAPAEGVTFEIDDIYDGAGSALVIRGTQAQVNAYLAGLQVELTGSLANSDSQYKVQVVADDRMRDVVSGALTGGANGGLNDNAGTGTTPVPTVPATIDPYAAVPGGLTANVASNARDLFPSAANDPAHIDISADPVRSEGSGTVQLSGITVTDSDALGDTLTATVTLPGGFTFASVNGSSSYPGVGTGSVTITGTLAQINDALNSIRIQLPDAAGAPLASDWNGSFDVTITVDDRGHNGLRPGSLAGDSDDATANPGDFSYADGASAALVTTRTFSVTVTPVNDAPQVANGTSEVLPSPTEDSNPTGTTVDVLFGGHFSDPVDQVPGGSSSNSFAGVAVVGLTTDPAQGAWQYFDGSSWVEIGNRTDANALILAAGTQVRFVPLADFHGTPNQMTVRLVETGDGGNGSTPPVTGTVVNLSGVGATGQTTRYSSGTVTLSTSVTNLNDRPTLADRTLPAVAEDTVSPAGQRVDAIFGSSYGDITDDQTGTAGGGDAATPFGGLAIVGNAAIAAEGTWQYSLDGGASWATIRTDVSDAAALLLPTDARLRFVPAANFNGDPGGLTVRGADAPVTFAAISDISGTVGSQTSIWSVTRTLTTDVTPLNDAPVLVGSPANPTVAENAQTGTGHSVPPTRLVTAGSADLSDLDLATTAGLGSGVFGAGTVTVSLGASYLAGDILLVDGALPPGATASAGTDGTLTISFDADTTLAEVEALIEQIAFRNTSDNPTNFGANTTRDYTITVSDGDNAQPGGNAGGPGSLAAAPIIGTLTITATNDPPVAVDDVNSIVENTLSVGGNVVAGGSGGAGRDSDPDSQVLTVTNVSFGGDPKPVGSAFDASYGKLTLNPDGSYTYQLDNNNPIVNALKAGDPPLTEVFTYTIDDGSGGTATATLTITITGVTDGAGPAIAPVDGNGGADGEAEVHEAGLGDPSNSETTTGAITVIAPDGLASIVVGGTTVNLAQLGNLSTTPVVIDTGEGTLTLTGFTPATSAGPVPTSGSLSYSYTLKAAQDTPGADQSLDPITLEVVDAGGSSAAGTLTIRIIDDAPVASADSVTIGENGTDLSGNVVTGGGAPGNAGDDVGADGPSISGAVTAVEFGGSAGTVGSALAGAYGSLTLNADGSYNYVLDRANPIVEALNPGQTLTETYTYTITDGDGDVSSTTLTITISGQNDAPVITGGGSSIAGIEDDVIVLAPSDFPFSDVDAGDGLESIRISGEPTRGGLYLNGVQVRAGDVVSIADIAAGKLTYRPAADGNGPSYATFGYQLGDGTDFSATGTMNIDIAPRNDTPTVAGPASATATEDTPLAFDGGGGADHAPALSIDDLVDLSQTGGSDLFTLTLSVGHGTLTIADPNGAVTGEGSGASLTLTGTRDALNDALATLTYLADADYSGTDQLLLGLDDHINAGSGTGAEPGTASHVVDILVLGQGDPPLLSARPAQGLEDSWVPLDIDIAGTDLSDPETVGLDLTGLPAGWSIRVGTGQAVVSMAAGQVFSFTAADLAAGLSVMAAPDANDAAGQSITLGLAAKSTDGNSTAVTRGQLTVSIAPVNDRPIASGEIVLPPIDGVGSSGGTVADLFGSHYNDVTDDASVSHGADRDTPLAGIAIVGNLASANEGVWQFDLGDGAGWRDIPNSGLGDRSALVLPASAQIRFVPAQGFSGQPGGLVARLSDGTGFQSGSGALVDLTAVTAGALGERTGGWSQQLVPVSVTVNALADTQAAFLDLPGYDRWGTTFQERKVYDEQPEGLLAYLEGRPVDRYTVAWQPISQQMIFRWSGGVTEGKLTYEATLGRNEPLPYWITFNATMQTVTAMPDHHVEPGIYVVRVVARDTAGHEAESALTIHVLHDNAKSMEEIRRRAQGDRPHFGAPVGSLDEPRGTDSLGRSELLEANGKEDAEAEAPDTGTRAEPVRDTRGASLTRSLIAFGPAGQMIEAARFLEALTSDEGTGR